MIVHVVIYHEPDRKSIDVIGVGSSRADAERIIMDDAEGTEKMRYYETVELELDK